MTARGLAEYPQVKDEFETLDALIKGASISRFGDGEVKMMLGCNHKYEAYNREQQQCLIDVLRRPREGLIVGIPRIVPECPRAAWWEPWKYRLMPFLKPDVTYYSSFISRPDHAPWIESDELFRGKMKFLWRDKRVVLVGSGKSLMPLHMPEALEVTFIQTPLVNAWPMREFIVKSILDAKPDVAILCCGMTATYVPYQLAYSGIQCLDLGAIGQQKLWNVAHAINAGERKE